MGTIHPTSTSYSPDVIHMIGVPIPSPSFTALPLPVYYYNTDCKLKRGYEITTIHSQLIGLLCQHVVLCQKVSQEPRYNVTCLTYLAIGSNCRTHQALSVQSVEQYAKLQPVSSANFHHFPIKQRKVGRGLGTRLLESIKRRRLTVNNTLDHSFECSTISQYFRLYCFSSVSMDYCE